MDIHDFYDKVGEAMTEEDLALWRILQRKYHKYFKETIREYGQSNFERGRDTNLEFRSLDG